MMSKVEILFFAADPLSAPPDGRIPRLLLDEDVRQIRQNVRAAEHRDALDFDVRWAARTDDLLQALNERRPQVVHFSGHGGNEGLVLVASDGLGPHRVDAAALAQLFQVFRGDIRVVVLNACFSLPQAEAIAGVVGCAIGTRGEISDAAAITFGASFYRAIAFGHSVQTAYDQARTALALEHFEDRECPQLVVGPGVDAARLVLVSPQASPGLRPDFPRDIVDDQDWLIRFHRNDEIVRRLESARPPPARSALGTKPALRGLAGTLARHFPTQEQFGTIARSFDFPHTPDRTLQEKWLGLVEECVARDEVELLVEQAERVAAEEDRVAGGRHLAELRSELPEPLAPTRREPLLGAEWTVFRRVRARLEELRSSTPRLPRLPRLSGAANVADPVIVFARSALVLTWGPGYPIPPELYEIETWLDSLSDHDRAVLQAASQAGWLGGGGEWAEPHLGEAVAAYALVADFEADAAGGRALVRWMLDHLHQLGPARRQILGLVMRWWAPGCDAATEWQAELLRADSRDLDPRCRRDVLLQLTRCDTLMAQIGLAPWADPALTVPGTRPGRAPPAAAGLPDGQAPSVAWALRSGQERYVPYVLESLGETRTSVYSALFSLVRSVEVQAALARALYRLARDTHDEPVLPGGVWGDAVRAAVPRFGPAARQRLRTPSVAAHWLEIVDPPYGDDDLRELAELFLAFAGSRLGARALDRLVLEPRMRRVWAALGSGRAPFVRDLPDPRLCRPDVAALIHELRERPPADPAERADAEALFARHRNTC
jgi:hypothetical protein